MAVERKQPSNYRILLFLAHFARFSDLMHRFTDKPADRASADAGDSMRYRKLRRFNDKRSTT